jgi:Zn-dependent M28 family amino/carboxypeptidase
MTFSLSPQRSEGWRHTNVSPRSTAKGSATPHPQSLSPLRGEGSPFSRAGKRRPIDKAHSYKLSSLLVVPADRPGFAQTEDVTGTMRRRRGYTRQPQPNGPPPHLDQTTHPETSLCISEGRLQEILLNGVGQEFNAEWTHAPRLTRVVSVMNTFAKLVCWMPLVAAAGSLLVSGCKTNSSSPGSSATPRMSTNTLMQHIAELSSDRYEGRAPGTPGEELTVNYLRDQFRRAGLKPGNPDGSYIQRVPLVGIAASDVDVRFDVAGQSMRFGFPTQSVVWTKRFTPEVRVEDSEVVFVGYGVVAPEYGWDDFKGVDVKGKTIVMLINDPAVPDPNDPSRLDERMFKGRAMTYYGRWTYKFEIAAEKGAAAAIIVHETGPAGYPWAVVQGSNSRENFDLRAANNNMHRIPVEGWITTDAATRLFQTAGQDFGQLKRAALTKDFRPVPLNAKASFRFKNTIREVQSQNVVGKVEGTDASLRDEWVVYTAHWDHLGRDTTLSGDQIFNGARDNATGLAALIEIGRAFAAAPPRRSVLFLAVTAEEKGLLGAKYYASEPLYPLARTVANINMDSMNTWGRTADITVIGMGQSSLEDVLRDVAGRQRRTLTPDAEPEKGRYFRSDHFEFAKRGVPGLYTHGGTNFVGQSADFGARKSDEYTTQDYHKVSDEIKPGWDLSGMAEDAALLFGVGQRVANGQRWPEWRADSEFRKLREPKP